MPSSATITAFYNFTAGTRAKAAEVTNNFDVLRGNRLPIHVSTATSANNTYDLGSSDYYWRTGYINNLYSTSISSTNIIHKMTTTTINTLLNYTTSSTNITGASISITTEHTKNLEIGLMYDLSPSSDAYFYSDSTIQTYSILNLSLYRDTTTSLVGTSLIRTNFNLSSVKYFSVDLGKSRFFDINLVAGTYNYFYKYHFTLGTTDQHVDLELLRMYIKPIKN
jgi:hypothetical protein